MAKNRFKVTLAGDELGTFDERKLTLEDAFVLENEASMTFNDLLLGIKPLKPRSLQALIWFMYYKRGDQIHLAQVPNFNLVELEIEVVADPPVAGSSDEDETDISEPSPNSAD